MKDLYTLLDEFKPANLHTKSNFIHVVGFFKKYSPLSNHHAAPQKVRNTEYNCNEQFYCHRKALLFGDTITGEKILQPNDPHTKTACVAMVTHKILVP